MFVQIGEWHFYDCVMHRKPDPSMWERLKSYLTRDVYHENIEMAKTAAHAMLPKLQNFDKTAAFLVLEDIRQLNKCFRPHLCEQDCRTPCDKYFAEVCRQKNT